MIAFFASCSNCTSWHKYIHVGSSFSRRWLDHRSITYSAAVYFQGHRWDTLTSTKTTKVLKATKTWRIVEICIVHFRRCLLETKRWITHERTIVCKRSTQWRCFLILPKHPHSKIRRENEDPTLLQNLLQTWLLKYSCVYLQIEPHMSMVIWDARLHLVEIFCNSHSLAIPMRQVFHLPMRVCQFWGLLLEERKLALSSSNMDVGLLECCEANPKLRRKNKKTAGSSFH